jgi:hypothetical protein
MRRFVFGPAVRSSPVIVSVLLTDDLVWELWSTRSTLSTARPNDESSFSAEPTELICILRTRSRQRVLRVLEGVLDAWH